MKLRGEWWFPNEPNKIFYGEYSFDEHIGAQLEILDIPEETIVISFYDHPQHPT